MLPGSLPSPCCSEVPPPSARPSHPPRPRPCRTGGSGVPICPLTRRPWTSTCIRSAMRAAGAPASSAPVLATSFMVSARTAYTVAGIGPDPGLREEVLQDQMMAPMGKALVRVIQASLKEHLVTVSYGSDVLARQLAFGAATSYAAVSPGAQTVQFTAPGEHAAMPVKVAADTVHTIVVLDGSSGLKVDALTDAVGSQTMPMGGVDTGLGGTAPRLPADPAPWLLMIAAGTLLTGAALRRQLRAR